MRLEKRVGKVLNKTVTPEDLVSEDNGRMITEASSNQKLKDVIYDYWTSVGRQTLQKLKKTDLSVEERPSRSKDKYQFDINNPGDEPDMLVSFYFNKDKLQFVFDVKYKGDVPLDKTAPIKEYGLKDTLNAAVGAIADKHARIIMLHIEK
jgi:hypothetical protein